MTERITLFSWGYWGWGNATPQWIQGVDAVEASRGFEPPFFVDTRISRSVRAKGFNGRAFEEVGGASRYRWMNDLGNLRVQLGSGRAVQIKNPAAAGALLDLAVEAANQRRRLIFFCSCEYPRLEHHPEACHRVTVARLLLAQAAKRRIPVEVVEWPGESPVDLHVTLTDKIARGLVAGRKSIPVGDTMPLSRIAGLPWGSIVHFEYLDQSYVAASGPARFGRISNSYSWYLPVPWDQAGTDRDALEARVQRWRREYGLESRCAPHTLT